MPTSTIRLEKDVYWDEHELEHKLVNVRISCPDWEWAELDRHRIVWASGGRLWAGQLGNNAMINSKLLYDSNVTFEAIAAPY